MSRSHVIKRGYKLKHAAEVAFWICWGEWFHPGVVRGKNNKLTLETEPVVRDIDMILTLNPGYQTFVMP